MLRGARRGLSTASRSVRPRRAVLYAPGSSTKMMAKAAGLGADSVVLDMEDGVAGNAKEAARANVAAALGELEFGSSERVVRINAVGSGFEEEDLAAVLALEGGALPDAILLPKADHPDHVRWLASRIEESGAEKRRGARIETVLLVESAASVLGLADIVAADRSRVTGVIFGGDDYAASVGAHRSPDNSEIAFARNLVLVQAKAAGLQSVIDVVQINYKRPDLLERESVEGFRLGYTGKQVIHPSQIETVHRCFSPDADEVAWARRLLDAFEHHAEQGKGAFSFENKMIDSPTVKIALNLVHRAEACEAADQGASK